MVNDEPNLTNPWHTPQGAIIKPNGLDVRFSWAGSDFINLSTEQLAALLSGQVIVLFRDFDDDFNDTIYLRLDTEARHE